MKSVSMLLLGLTVAVSLLVGCSAEVPPIKQEGEIDLKAAHYITPKDGELYRIHNLKEPGGDVFLFPSDEALAQCYFAIESGENVREICWSGVEAKVEDGALLKALECHKSKYAVCTVRMLEGHAIGVQGVMLWDWLEPKQK